MTEQTFVHLLAVFGATLLIGELLVSAWRNDEYTKADKILMSIFAICCYLIVLFVVIYYQFLAV